MKMLYVKHCKNMNLARVDRQEGFTLIEVIVAVGIIAVALPALLFSMAQDSNRTADTTRDSIAYWVAHNQMATVKLEYELTERLAKGEITGQSEMAGQRWDWRIVTQESELPEMWRITVTAELAGSESPVELVGFLRANEDNSQTGQRNR